MAEVSRNNQLLDEVVFLDGLGGTGKTMMGPVLSSFRRVEIQRMDHVHEYICALCFLKKIEDDAAVALLRLYGDLALYNVFIARDSNFRIRDLSGVLRNPGGWKQLIRLIQPDGEAVLARINKARPILQIHSHQLLGISQPLFRAFGERLKVVEMVRHPLYLLEFYSTWIDRIGKDPRDFSVFLNFRGEQLPWYVSGWEEKFLSSQPMDRVIYLVDRLMGLADAAVRTADEATRSRVLVIPFERFVVDPWPYLHRIEGFLGTTMTSTTRSALRKQNIPRQVTTDGKDLSIYRRYNWRPPEKGSGESAELIKQWNFAAREATGKGMEVLERLCRQYEENYLHGDTWRRRDDVCGERD